MEKMRWRQTASSERLTVMSSVKIVNLETICWAFSLGGEHFTGQIKGFRHSLSDFHGMEVKHRLGRKEALRLNKKDSARGLSLHKPGDWSDRFNTRDELRRAAIKVYKTEFPNAIVLLDGNGAIADAQPCLDGPKKLKDAINKIVAEGEACGGYEGNRKKMDALFRRYRKLVDKL